MFIVWYDDLMEISGFWHTTTLRQYFVVIYGYDAWNRWTGQDRKGWIKK